MEGVLEIGETVVEEREDKKKKREQENDDFIFGSWGMIVIPGMYGYLCAIRDLLVEVAGKKGKVMGPQLEDGRVRLAVSHGGKMDGTHKEEQCR